MLEGIIENDTPSSAHREQPDRSEVIYKGLITEHLSDLLRETSPPDKNIEIIDHSSGMTKRFFTTTVTGEPEKYLGASEAYMPVSLRYELKSSKQTILYEVYDATRGPQATREKIDCAPQ